MQFVRHAVVPLAVSAVLALSACAKADFGTPAPSSGAPAAGTGTASCRYPAAGEAAKPVDPPATSDVPNTGTSTVTLVLDGKPVVVTVDRQGAPCTANSFESLARQGFYTNTTCWRLTDQGLFVLQCGDPTLKGDGGPGYTFADELTTARALPSNGKDSHGNPLVTYPKGTVAMANAGADTNGSQFFIVYEDSPLNPNYTVLGTVDAPGLLQVQQVAAEGVAADGHSPNAPAKITTVSLG